MESIHISFQKSNNPATENNVRMPTPNATESENSLESVESVASVEIGESVEVVESVSLPHKVQSINIFGVGDCDFHE